MSWADQGFSWDMTHPREVFNHLWAALMEREDDGNPYPPDPLEPYHINEFQLFDGRLFGSQYLDDGVSSKFSIPGTMDLPDPADILAGEKIPYTIQPITIEYLEEALGEPLIRVMPDRKAWLLRKLYLPWVIQRYRILNLLIERVCGLPSYANAKMWFRQVYRSYKDGSDGMIEEIQAMPFSNGGWADNGITTESRSSKYESFVLRQDVGSLNLAVDIRKSCDVQVYAFGANKRAGSGLWCLDQVSEYEKDSTEVYQRYEYSDFGYGIPLGEYTLIKSFTYNEENPENFYFIDSPPDNIPVISPVSIEKNEDQQKVMILPYEGCVRKFNYAPYLKYYDPVM